MLGRVNRKYKLECVFLKVRYGGGLGRRHANLISAAFFGSIQRLISRFY